MGVPPRGTPQQQQGGAVVWEERGAEQQQREHEKEKENTNNAPAPFPTAPREQQQLRPIFFGGG